MDLVYNVASKIINIDSERQRYATLFDCVKNTIMRGLKQNKDFKTLFLNEKLCGSYADNLKISKPDEFDLIMQLHLPFPDRITISPDVDSKGNVLIDLTNIVDELQDDKYKFLYSLIDKNNYLLQNKLLNWIESIMVKFLNQIERTIIHFKQEYKLRQTKQGPALTIYVYKSEEDKHLISIDFVLGIVFGVDKSVSKRNPTKNWEAIPRPLKTAIATDNYSFRTSYTESERTIISEKQQLKKSLRILKKFRDQRKNMTGLKSYYLKTLFLWIDIDDPTFWSNNMTNIMRTVFAKLEDCLNAGEIKFFWDDELNMLLTLKKTQIAEMKREVRNARRILNHGRSQKDILRLFLSEEEIHAIPEVQMRLIADGLAGETNKYIYYSIALVFLAVLIFQLYRIFIK